MVQNAFSLSTKLNAYPLSTICNWSQIEFLTFHLSLSKTLKLDYYFNNNIFFLMFFMTCHKLLCYFYNFNVCTSVFSFHYCYLFIKLYSYTSYLYLNSCTDEFSIHDFASVHQWERGYGLNLLLIREQPSFPKIVVHIHFIIHFLWWNLCLKTTKELQRQKWKFKVFS